MGGVDDGRTDSVVAVVADDGLASEMAVVVPPVLAALTVIVAL